MIQFKSLRQYTRVVDGIRFPQNSEQPFLLMYFSENSILLEDYMKLNIRRADIRHAVIPITKIPRTKLTLDIQKLFKNIGLLAYSTTMSFPKDKNLIYDFSTYLFAIDETYKPVSYRQKAGFLIKNMLLKSYINFDKKYQKVLLYSVDITKSLNTFTNRKIFPILQQMKLGEIYFDHLILAIVDESGIRYRLLVKDKEFNFSRLIQYIKKIKTIDSEEEKELLIKNAANTVVDKVQSQLIPKGRSKVQNAVDLFVTKDPAIIDKVEDNKLDSYDAKRITIASVIHNVSGDIEKAKRIARSIPKNKLTKAVAAVDKNFVDELLPKQKTISLSDSIVVEKSDVPKMVDNKSPEHIIDKRRIDFEINLKKDTKNSFKVLENKEIPLKIESISMVQKSQRKGEIDKSDIATIKVDLKDKDGHSHKVEIDIPNIDPDTGTFRVFGSKKCLMNQIVLCPISFPKPYDSKFQSSYSSFHIYSKKTKKYSYLEAYMGSFRLPFSILLFYSFGFEKTLAKYKIKYNLVSKNPGKNTKNIKINEDQYIVFDNIDSTLKEELYESFIKAKILDYKVEYKFGSKEYFNDLIVKMTGRVNSTYLINNNLENIVDPMSKQVLLNQQLPGDIESIMFYMASKVVTGFAQDRNDITNQRIRNSEILVHLIQKQVLASYTEYREQVLAGNKDAEFNMVSGKVLSDFINSQIVMDMEYANPLEELAMLTRITPVGKGIGGITDKVAIQLDARNVHPSYFGNIDPLDTPEGDNVGVVQQLTVDAYITSARGLIEKKDISNKEYSGLLSTSVSMIPFVEANEGARILMVANQSRQMLPLKNPDPPVIQSGYESILANSLSNSFIKKTPCTGKITDITKDHINITCKNGKKSQIDITPVHLKSGSGKNTLSTFIPKVSKGQMIKENEVIAEGSCISGGTISLGRTLAATYMPYKGYNFEDGVVINERLVNEEKLTSLHGIEIEVPISSKDRILNIVKIGTKTKKGETILRKTIGEIEELIGIGDEEDEGIELTEGQLIRKSPGGTIVDIEVYSNLAESKFPDLEELINRTDKKYGKPTKERFTVRGVPIKGILIKFKIEQELIISLGDKLCNRYGNKGIISLIEKDSFMPRTPWGETVDIVFSPLGVLGRMNIGQMYELYTSLISKKLADIIVETKNQVQVVKIMKTVLNKLDTSPSQKFSNTLVSNISKLSKVQFENMTNQIKTTGFVPIIIPPFKSPSYKHISEALKVLKLKTGYHLKLPEFNTKTKEPVPFGYIYISKLEHIGSEKIHTRSVGPIEGKTKQPLAGKRKEGGQRMGEADTYALLGYNCPKMLAEFFGPLSDDSVTKNEMISEIVQNGSAEYRTAKTNPTKDLLNAYFVSLMLGK